MQTVDLQTFTANPAPYVQAALAGEHLVLGDTSGRQLRLELAEPSILPDYSDIPGLRMVQKYQMHSGRVNTNTYRREDLYGDDGR